VNPPAVQEVLDLALKKLSVEMPEVIPFHKVTYRFDLNCDNNCNDLPIRLISDTSIVQSAQPRVMNEEEHTILLGILDMLESKEKKESVVLKATIHKSQAASTAVRQEDSDSGSDIFEDAGTDYVLEPRPKSAAQESLQPTDMKYFKEEEPAKANTSDLHTGESKLKDLLEVSREMNRVIVGDDKKEAERKVGGPDQSEDEEEDSMHMLEDVIADDGVNYDYAFDYSDDEDEGKDKLKVSVHNESATGANKLNQEFQQMNKVYEKKFGKSLQKEGGGESKRKTVGAGDVNKKRQKKS
jgi:hypothetical protein